MTGKGSRRFGVQNHAAHRFSPWQDHHYRITPEVTVKGEFLLESGPELGIESGNEKFKLAVEHKNAAWIADCYTENARLIPPGKEVIQGHDAIQAYWQAAMDGGVEAVDLDTLEIKANGGNQACEIGECKLAIRKGAETMLSTGKYVMVWKKEDHTWKIDVDIWNG